jgi:hypothetical protein
MASGARIERVLLPVSRPIRANLTENRARRGSHSGLFFGPGPLAHLEMSMRSKGLGTCARQLLLEVSTIRSMDVILPVKNRGQLRRRLVARPDKPVPELLAHLGLALPTSPKIIENLVEKIA